VSARLLGLLAALLGLAVDQAHKWWMLEVVRIAERGPVRVAPFLDLVMVWNEGVSYGLFQQGSDLGRLLLILLGLGGAALFGWWLWRAPTRLSAVSLGLIVGGALSNVIDRLVYGAVADFFLFHVGGFEWYVFNLADVWIVAGVIGVLIAWALERPENATER
jgi:signal peptidase II